MIRLGITGGIGAGKSYVARLLTAQFQVPVYDCDRQAKRIMVENPDVRQQLVALVGSDAYQADGQSAKLPPSEGGSVISGRGGCTAQYRSGVRQMYKHPQYKKVQHHSQYMQNAL